MDAIPGAVVGQVSVQGLHRLPWPVHLSQVAPRDAGAVVVEAPWVLFRGYNATGAASWL